MKENDLLLSQNLTKDFEWLHRHPELSFQEKNTTEFIRERLSTAGIQIPPLPLETGLVAQIDGELPGPTVALRCDIDALPIQEEAELPYRSEEPGKMHACGHDFHTTAVLGAALLLKEREKDLRGRVKLIFQPGEESSLGALKIVESGVLSDVDVIFGIHVIPNIPVGTVVIGKGNITAAVDRFSVTIRGKGSHAAYPQNSIDPVVAAAQLISSAQTVVSRNVNPFHSSLVSITHISSGSTWNVIPEEAFLEGTVRTLQKEDRVLIPRRLQELAENTAKAYGAEADFRWIPGPPATDNDPEWSVFAAGAARESGLNVVPPTPSLGGEDFAFYQETLRGVYIQVGTGKSEQNHHPKFRVDPGALFPTSAYLASLAEKALHHLTEQPNGGKQ